MPSITSITRLVLHYLIRPKTQAGVHIAGLLALVAVLFSSSCLALGNTSWGLDKGRRAKAHHQQQQRGRDWLVVAFHALALGLAGLSIGVAVAAAASPDPVGLARPVAGLSVGVTWALLSLLAALYPPSPSALSVARSSSVLIAGLDAVRRLLAPAAAVLSLLLLILEAHVGCTGATVVAAVGTVGWLVQTTVAWALGVRSSSPRGRKWRWWPRRARGGDVDTSSTMPLISVLEDGDGVAVEVEEEGKEDDDEEQLESHASVMSRLTFWWITPLLSQGYRAKTLAQEDLPHLERCDQPPVAHAAFRREWGRTVSRASPAARAKGRGGHMVLGALMRTNWVTFVACGLVLAVSTVLQLMIPVVLNRLLDHIDAGAEAAGGVALGYTLAVGLFVLVVLQSMTEHQFWIWGIRCGMRCQVGWVGLVGGWMG